MLPPQQLKPGAPSDLEKRISRALMQGTIAQITLALQTYFDLLSETYLLYILVPVFVLLNRLHAPEVMQTLVHSVAINTAMTAIDDKEVALALVNLLAVYMIGTSFMADSQVTSSAQYLLALRIVQIVPIDSVVGLVLAVLFYSVRAQWGMLPRMYDTMSLVFMLLVQNWFLAHIPEQFQNVFLVMVLYSLSVFAAHSSAQDSWVVQAYNFVIMTSTKSFKISGVSYWTQAAVCAAVWVARTDTLSQTFFATVAVRMVQLAFIEALAPHAEHDPFLVYSLLVVMLYFL